MRECKCKKCGYVWPSRVDSPKQCPKCRNYKWNEEKKTDGEENNILSCSMTCRKCGKALTVDLNKSEGVDIRCSCGFAYVVFLGNEEKKG